MLKLRHNARSQSPLKQDWYLETEKANYENKIHVFQRGEMFYMQDSTTGKQTSLRTKDETEAKSLLEARNAAQRQPVLNLHLARAYAKKAIIVAPSLEDYEQKATTPPSAPAAVAKRRPRRDRCGGMQLGGKYD